MRLADCVRSSGSGSGATDAPCAEFPMYLKDEMNLKVGTLYPHAMNPYMVYEP